MTYLLTMLRLARGGVGDDNSSSFEVASEIEAMRIDQEGAMIAGREGELVLYEVYDGAGRLVMSLTSASIDA